MNLGKIVIVCGWALAGKDTIAAELSKRLDMPWLDIDQVRRLNFGAPNPLPVSVEEMDRDRLEMKGSYQLLYSSVGINAAMGRSLIATATFSRAAYWDSFFQSVAAAGASPKLRVIWCKPENDSDEEIAGRLARRQFGVNCWSPVNTLARYNEVKGRFQAPPIEHLMLDTSPPNTIESCVNLAAQYILS